MFLRKRKSTWRELPSRIFVDEPVGKDLEAKLLRHFLRIMQISDYVLEPRERPDFVIRFIKDGEEVDCGCELTFLNSDSNTEISRRGSPERRFFSQWKTFAQRLRDDLLRSSKRLASVYGAVHFKESCLDIFDDCDEASLRKEIVEILQSWSGRSTIKRFDSQKYPLLAKFVRHIYLEETAVEDGPLWWCAHLQSGEIADPTDTLIEIVTRKCERARGYDWGKASRKWLLICARATGLSDAGFIGKDPAIAGRLQSIPYSEIFYWELAFGSLYELFPVFRERTELAVIPALSKYGLRGDRASD